MQCARPVHGNSRVGQLDRGSCCTTASSDGPMLPLSAPSDVSTVLGADWVTKCCSIAEVKHSSRVVETEVGPCSACLSKVCNDLCDADYVM